MVWDLYKNFTIFTLKLIFVIQEKIFREYLYVKTKSKNYIELNVVKSKIGSNFQKLHRAQCNFWILKLNTSIHEIFFLGLQKLILK